MHNLLLLPFDHTLFPLRTNADVLLPRCRQGPRVLEKLQVASPHEYMGPFPGCLTVWYLGPCTGCLTSSRRAFSVRSPLFSFLFCAAPPQATLLTPRTGDLDLPPALEKGDCTGKPVSIDIQIIIQSFTQLLAFPVCRCHRRRELTR